MTLPNLEPQSVKSVGRVEPITTSNIECTQQCDQPAQDPEAAATDSNTVSTLVTKSKKAASSLFTLLHAKVQYNQSDNRAELEYEQRTYTCFHMHLEL